VTSNETIESPRTACAGQERTCVEPTCVNNERPARPRWKRAVRLVVQVLILGAVGYYVVRAFGQGFGSVDWSTFHLHPAWLLAGGACMLVSVLMVCLATAANIAAMVTPSPRTVVMVAATAISRMGRYVPGKVLSVAGVSLLLRPYGVGMVVGTSAVLLNSVLSVLTGLLVSAPLLALDPNLAHYVPMGGLWAGLIVLASLVFLHPSVNFPVLNYLLRKMGKPPLVATMRMTHYILPTVGLLLQWLALGMGMWCIGRSIDPDLPLTYLWAFTATGALALTVGFLALVAPGGIGVREAIFLAVLTPLMGLAAASMLAVGMRLMTMVTEAIAALAGVAVLKLNRPEAEKA